MVTGTMWRSNIITGKIVSQSVPRYIRRVMFQSPKLLAAKLKCLFKYEVLPAKPRVSLSGQLCPPPVISTITEHGGDIS